MAKRVGSQRVFDRVRTKAVEALGQHAELLLLLPGQQIPTLLSHVGVTGSLLCLAIQGLVLKAQTHLLDKSVNAFACCFVGRDVVVGIGDRHLPRLVRHQVRDEAALVELGSRPVWQRSAGWLDLAVANCPLKNLRLKTSSSFAVHPARGVAVDRDQHLFAVGIEDRLHIRHRQVSRLVKQRCVPSQRVGTQHSLHLLGVGAETQELTAPLSDFDQGVNDVRLLSRPDTATSPSFYQSRNVSPASGRLAWLDHVPQHVARETLKNVAVLIGSAIRHPIYSRPSDPGGLHFGCFSQVEVELLVKTQLQLIANKRLRHALALLDASQGFLRLFQLLAGLGQQALGASVRDLTSLSALTNVFDLSLGCFDPALRCLKLFSPTCVRRFTNDATVDLTQIAVT